MNEAYRVMFVCCSLHRPLKLNPAIFGAAKPIDDPVAKPQPPAASPELHQPHPGGGGGAHPPMSPPPPSSPPTYQAPHTGQVSADHPHASQPGHSHASQRYRQPGSSNHQPSAQNLPPLPPSDTSSAASHPAIQSVGGGATPPPLSQFSSCKERRHRGRWRPF